ncbi:enoyl-CoA hydratase/isomerase family protein [Pseudomonas sp. NFX98]|uniref:enoyl-CoA hydratase/isomerase family protein n=1 Tax=Pseudomonas sp. NFX98 TaxID=3399122 RepID=UPI0039FCAD50
MNTPSPTVLLDITDAVARITLNRPNALNAITVELAEEFLQAVKVVSRTPSVRVAIISGKGKAFCAGGDLAYLQDATPRKARVLIDPLHEAVELLTRLDIPVIACIHGVVAGAGVSLAVACDFVLAAEGTRFNLAYTGIGTSPDASASWHIPRLIGTHKSMELLLLSTPFDAIEALHIGLITQVHPVEQLEAACSQMARRLATAATRALAQTKRLIRSSTQHTLKEHLEAERAAFCACVETRDFSEGVNAFISKRIPSFRGE